MILGTIFPAVKNGRTMQEQAMYQILALICTLVLALIGNVVI